MHRQRPGDVVDLLDRDAEVQQPCNKRIIDKVASRELGVTAVAVAAAAPAAAVTPSLRLATLSMIRLLQGCWT